MDYNQINLFLEKFKKILFKKEELYLVISETIKKHISHTINQNNIKIDGSNIYIKTSPMLRSEILIHKSIILADLNQLLPESQFKDIL